jgi:hypothetical protein
MHATTYEVVVACAKRTVGTWVRGGTDIGSEAVPLWSQHQRPLRQYLRSRLSSQIIETPKTSQFSLFRIGKGIKNTEPFRLRALVWAQFQIVQLHFAPHNWSTKLDVNVTEITCSTHVNIAGDTVWKYRDFVKSVSTGVLFATKLMSTGVGRGSPATRKFH